MNDFKILLGDCNDTVTSIDEVHCVVTSPPYFRKRQYGKSDLEMGYERDVKEYVEKLVDLFCKIPLHRLGSIWVNIGDKRKDGALCNIPSIFSMKMMECGFQLIDHVIWAKSIVGNDGKTIGNCMTEPCLGRLNGNGYEDVFRFINKGVKLNECWTDVSAVQLLRENVEPKRYLPEHLMISNSSLTGRNLHNVWQMPMGQTNAKHYAVYPPVLCERPIAMTCPLLINPDGTMPRRLVEFVEYDEGKGKKRVFGKSDTESTTEKKGRQDTGRQYVPRMPISMGWDNVQEGATPGIVLDPFNGTGTTGDVALKLGRSYIGLELYEEYEQISTSRLQETLDAISYHEIVSTILENVDDETIAI
jgi:DNA modification methylase